MRRLCLHKNVLQAHTTGKPLGLAKNVRTLAYGLQDATVLSKGSPPGEEVEGTTKIAHTQEKREKSLTISDFIPKAVSVLFLRLAEEVRAQVGRLL